MGILCVFCIYDTIGNDVNIVSKNQYNEEAVHQMFKRESHCLMALYIV